MMVSGLMRREEVSFGGGGAVEAAVLGVLVALEVGV